MKTAIYWTIAVEVVQLFTYYALVRHQGMSFVVPVADLVFQGGN